MASGYKVYWTDHALSELKTTYEYLESNFTENELHTLSQEIDQVIFLLLSNPYLFQESEIMKGVRKVIILKYNTLYYRLNKDHIEILSFFSNRKNPNNFNPSKG